MSEQGWKAFLAAMDGSDWVVLHGGAAAVYRVGSLSEAARLAEAVALSAEIAGRGVVLTVSDNHLTIRLTRDIWQLEPTHIVIAKTISAIAREHGARPDRAAVQEVQLAIAAQCNEIDVNFLVVLGYSPMADDNATAPLGHGSSDCLKVVGSGSQGRPIRVRYRG